MPAQPLTQKDLEELSQATKQTWLCEQDRHLLEKMVGGYITYRLSRRHEQAVIQSDRNTLYDFLRHAGGIPGQVTPSDFEKWAAHLWLERHVAASTQRKYQAIVRVFFDYLLRQPQYRNLVRQTLGVDVVQVATPENCILHRDQEELTDSHGRRCFTDEEIARFFEASDREIEYAYAGGSHKVLVAHQRDKAMFWTLYKLGLRADEVIRLNTNSFEPNPQFREEFGPYGIARVFGKGKKWRSVTVTEPTVPDILDWYIHSIRPHYLNRTKSDENALFLSEQGRRIGYSALHKRYTNLLDLAGLDRSLTPHCMRHTSVSEKDMDGLSLEANRRQHGHTFSATTQGYMHHPDKFIQESFSRIIRTNLHKTSESNGK